MSEKSKTALAWLATIVGLAMVIIGVIGIVNIIIDSLLTLK